MVKGIVDGVESLVHDPVEVMSFIKVVLVIERVLEMHLGVISRHLVFRYSNLRVSQRSSCCIRRQSSWSRFFLSFVLPHQWSIPWLSRRIRWSWALRFLYLFYLSLCFDVKDIKGCWLDSFMFWLFDRSWSLISNRALILNIEILVGTQPGLFFDWLVVRVRTWLSFEEILFSEINVRRISSFRARSVSVLHSHLRKVSVCVWTSSFNIISSEREVRRSRARNLIGHVMLLPGIIKCGRG